MAVDAVLRLKQSGNLDAIQITKVRGGTLQESFLDEGNLIKSIFFINIFVTNYTFFQDFC